MTSSRLNDYLPGTYATGQNDPNAQLYVISASDPDFDIGITDQTKKSWAQWKDAVALGADFYDGDHDGVYNPVDLNGNGKWDPDEDRPDILGDVTAWCVYSDQMPPALRFTGFNDVNPQGIEIRQTVFAFNSKAAIGNTIFIRYKIVNTGTVADVLDSVYFSAVADADIGDNGALDLVGSDTLLNAGYTYHPTSESEKWGQTPPCFLIDFLQGPRSYIPGESFIDNNANGVYDDGIDTPIDTATDVRGSNLGIAKYPGAKNLGLSSFFQYYNGTDPASKFQLRDYTLGLNNVGNKINPCTWTQGSVLGGVNCAKVDPNFMYSGDPIAGIGWIDNLAQDQRQISSTGPFTLVKNDTVSIVVAYVVGQGTNGLNSVTVAKNNDMVAQSLFDSNFPSTFVGINDKSISKINFNLNQNYPNPFNPTTVISYSLPSASNIKLIVYNTLGQTVKIIENEYKNAGNYTVNFNASNLPSGIYFYKLEAGQYSQIKKMILLK